MVTMEKQLQSAARTLRGDLESHIAGHVLVMGDPDYNEKRKAYNLSVDQHPDVIVEVADAHDIVQALRFAEEYGMGVAVQATGHGVKRPADGAMLILTSAMQGVKIDPEAGTARVEAGVRWGAVLEKAQAFGLAPLLGSSTSVGAVGYTLGGGFGWLGRKYGLSTDSVHSFEFVTPADELLHVSRDENRDLFWALRGGGGSLGIVASMEIQLYPVTTVYAGNLFYPVGQAREVFGRYREWIAGVPDELTSSVSIAHFPPFPSVPEPLRGQAFAVVRGCYVGPEAEGEALLRFWRAWRRPQVDLFGPMSFRDAASISSDPPDPVPFYNSGAWLRDLADDAVEALVSHGAPAAGDPPFVHTEVRHAGGVIARVDPESTAYSHRTETLLLNLIATTPTPEAYAHATASVEALMQDLAPSLSGGVYPNFLSGAMARARIADAYTSDAYLQLRAIKAIVDPANRLGYSFNIEPLLDTACEEPDID